VSDALAQSFTSPDSCARRAWNVLFFVGARLAFFVEPRFCSGVESRIMTIQIEFLDHSGHTTLHAESVEVAQEKLTQFLNDCVRKYGHEPPVWARRAGEREGDEMGQLANPRHADLESVTQIVCQPSPLIGG
jgi:hypothetical protein